MLLDKLIKRKIAMLDLLNDSEELSIQEMQPKLRVTVKTIRKDLNELLVDSPYSEDDVSIEKHGSKYSLIKKETTNVEIIKTNFKKKSLFFKIYYSVFKENFLISNNPENQFFCSKTKIYKEFKLLKKYVESKGVDIDRRDTGYYLKGSELLIRFQAYHYFWGIYKGIEGLVNSEFKKKVNQLVYEIECDLGVNFSTIDRERLKSWFWISEVRIDLGKWIEKNKYFKESAPILLNMKKIEQKISLFLSDSKESYLNQEEVDFLVLVLKMILRKSLYNNKDKVINESDVFNLGNKFMLEFEQKFDVKKDFFSISYLIGEALFYHQNLNIDLLNISIVEHSKVELFDRYLDEFFSNFVVENKLKMANKEKLYAYLYSLCYEQVAINNYKPKLCIAVRISEGEFYEHKIKQELMKLKYNLNLEEKDLKLTDLIITDYINEEHEDKILYCSSTISLKMMSVIKEKLSRLEKKLT